jgi:hypothetical protein
MEVTKILKSIWLDDFESGTPTFAEIEMMNNQTILISSIQLKQQKAYFEALSKRKLPLCFLLNI